MILDTGGGQGEQIERQFYFEKQWCQMDGFLKLVDNKWGETKNKCPDNVYSLDKWHGCVALLRNFLKGWGRNVRGDYRRKKNELMEQIQCIDGEMPAQGGGADAERWRKRYQLECVTP
jgi:hypothetical protein